MYGEKLCELLATNKHTNLGEKEKMTRGKLVVNVPVIVKIDKKLQEIINTHGLPAVEEAVVSVLTPEIGKELGNSTDFEIQLDDTLLLLIEKMLEEDTSVV